MDLTPSTEQQMLRDSARRYLSDRHATGAAMWRDFAEMGWLGLPFEEGCGAVEVAVLAEEMGRAAVIAPFVPVVVLAGGLIAALGDPGGFLPGLAAGDLVVVLAHLENGARGRPDSVGTRAVQARDGGWHLTGTKILVPAAGAADMLLVTARVDDRRIGLFAVPARDPGVTITPVPTVDGGEAGDISLFNVLSSHRLDRGDILPALDAAHDRANAAACADALGAMEALLDATVTYAKQRVQFGKPLAAMQALQHRMAEMAVLSAQARAAALFAALSVDAPAPLRIRAVSGARVTVGRAARKVAQESIQLHGAIGYSEDLPVGGWFRRLYAFENTLGSTAEHQRRHAAVAMAPDMLGGLLRAPGAA